VMIRFCQSWPGEVATGTPAMAADWITDILARLNGRRDPPRDLHDRPLGVSRMPGAAFGRT
jgi:hypothetical protein